MVEDRTREDTCSIYGGKHQVSKKKKKKKERTAWAMHVEEVLID